MMSTSAPTFREMNSARGFYGIHNSSAALFDSICIPGAHTHVARATCALYIIYNMFVISDVMYVRAVTSV